MSEPMTAERERYLRFKHSWHVNDVDQAGEMWAEIELLTQGLHDSEVRCGEAANARMAAVAEIGRIRAERDKLQAFKDWVHAYLDDHDVPYHPPGTHGAAGCRIGDRMDWLMARVAELEAELTHAKSALDQFAFAHGREHLNRELRNRIDKLLAATQTPAEPGER